MRAPVHLVQDERQQLLGDRLKVLRDLEGEARRPKRADVILAQAQTIAGAGVEHRLDHLDAVVVGRQDLEPDPIDGDEGSARGDVDQLLRLLRLILVADHRAREVGAVLREHLLLDLGTDRVLAVGDDRQTRLARGDGRGRHHRSLVLGDRVARRELDDPRPDAGRPDPLLDLEQVQLGHLFRRAHAPVVRQAGFFLVETGRAHDLHPRPLGDLCHQLGVAPHLDRARIDERLHAVLFELLHPLRRHRERIGARPRAGRVELIARIREQDVLVHERPAELRSVDGSEHRLDERHIPSRV